MKTSVNSYRLLYQGMYSLLIVLVIMALGACEKEPEHSPFPPSRPQVSAGESYIGQYELKRADGLPAKIIGIEQFTPINQNDPLTIGPFAVQVQVFSLVNDSENRVVATWNSHAYIIKSQEIVIGHQPTTISGKISLFGGDLSVFYQLKAEENVSTYSELFRKM